MRLRRIGIWIVLALMILIPSAGIIYLLGTPEIVSVSPEAGAQNAAATAHLEITFSRPMRAEAVTERMEIEPAQPGEFQWQGTTLIFTPREPWPSGETVRVRLAPGARAAGLLSLPLRETSTWSFQVAQPRLAYLYPSDGPANVYLLSPGPGESQALTDLLTGVLEYDFNSEGTLLYYSANTGGGGTAIFRKELLPQSAAAPEAGEAPALPLGEPEIVLGCPQASCRAPRISPQGDFLAYERTALPGGDEPAYARVWLLPLDGEEAPFLAGNPAGQTQLPHWSPTGLLTYYDSRRQAFVVIDPRDGELAAFENETGLPGSWSPDGSSYVVPEITFLTESDRELLPDIEDLAAGHLLRFSLSGGAPENLTQVENLEDTAPAYSPDGRLLAFARRYLDVQRWTPGRQLWLLPLDGSDARQITDEPVFNHYDFTWSPDSKWLAYMRFNQTILLEPPEIWLFEQSPGRTRRLVKGGYAPQWIP